MKIAEKIIAKIEADHWLLLKRGFEGDWTFEIWGIHPLSGRVGRVATETAKQRALWMAQEHFSNYGLPSDSLEASKLSWRVAVLQHVA